MTASVETLETEIVRQVTAAGTGKTVAPMDIARALDEGAGWQTLLPALRRVAVRLAQDGRIAIYRKGKPVDPGDFKGVYRLGRPPQA
jgi:hypothetical protein